MESRNRLHKGQPRVRPLLRADVLGALSRRIRSSVRTRLHHLRLRPERIEQPLAWKRPQNIFVNSMSDLFHVGVPDEFIIQVFDIMSRASWHQFQLLTKRPERLKRLSKRLMFAPNIWVGVSVESPKYYWRIRQLLCVPAAVRFLSCEPLLDALPDIPLDGVDWVIVGGESGHGARPMEAAWVRNIRAQCRKKRIAFSSSNGVERTRRRRGEFSTAKPMIVCLRRSRIAY